MNVDICIEELDIKERERVVCGDINEIFFKNCTKNSLKVDSDKCF